MSSRDMYRKETKKPKKDGKKSSVSAVVMPSQEVTVIRKKRKPADSEG